MVIKAMLPLLVCDEPLKLRNMIFIVLIKIVLSPNNDLDSEFDHHLARKPSFRGREVGNLFDPFMEQKVVLCPHTSGICQC